MVHDDKTQHHDQDDHDATAKKETAKPNAYRVDDDKNLEEKDLKTTYLFGEGKMKSTQEPGMEGQGMGGHNFGENNLTPSGDDKDNPSRYGGYENAYFRRTQPAEEHPEDSNFVVKNQEGRPDYGKDQPNIPGPNEVPEQQKVSEEQGRKTPNPQEEYREGTVDDDGPRSKKDYKGNDPEKWHVET